MKENFQNQLDSILQTLNSSKKPTLLLHACCGPCSSYVIEYLCNYFNITILFYNPNIYPQEEYFRRLNELKTFYTKFPPVLENKIKLIETDFVPDEFYTAINIQNEPNLATEKEKGVRCFRCYNFRLQKTYEFAFQNNFDYFCTTLSISPFKDAQKINKIGMEITNNNLKSGPKWLTSDFKKKNGFKRSLELSTQYNLYRQEYCGCVYSLNCR